MGLGPARRRNAPVAARGIKSDSRGTRRRWQSNLVATKAPAFPDEDPYLGLCLSLLVLEIVDGRHMAGHDDRGAAAQSSPSHVHWANRTAAGLRHDERG